MRPTARRPIRRRGRVRFGALLAGALLLPCAGCASEQGHSPDLPKRYQDARLGAAHLLDDATDRVHSVVDVTSVYRRTGRHVVGAAVLVDETVGAGAPRTDTRHRPVLVVYTSGHTAERAVRGRRPSTYLRNGNRVVLLPPAFPRAARRAYEQGLGAALQ